MKAPVSLCCICKNEAPRLEACLKSIRDYVTEIVIVDTGSTDGSQEIIKKYADIFEQFSACNNPDTGFIEDFSMARQRSFDLATQPWVYWTDMDDIILNAQNLPGIINAADLARGDRPGCIILPYEYAHNEKDQVVVRQYRERLFSPKSEFKWINPVHEVCNINNPNTYVLTIDDITHVHRRQNKSIEPNRNLRILEKYIEKHGEADARQLYYIGLEYGNVCNFEKMIYYLNKYLDQSGWDDEKVMACLRLGIHYLGTGEYPKVIDICLKAIAMQEHWAEPYLLMAKAFYLLADIGKDPTRNYLRCVNFARQGLSYPPTKTLLFINPLEREYEIHKFLNVALSKLGDVEGALASCIKGMESNPEDPWLVCNKKIYQKHLSRLSFNKETAAMLACEGITQEIYDRIMALLDKPNEENKSSSISNHLVCIESFQKAGCKIENSYVTENGGLFTELSDSNAIGNLFSNASDALDIIFFVGNGFENWTPESIKRTGMGGSELMAMEMAKGLAALGHRVRLYNSCGPLGEGIYDKVEYLHTDKFINTTCDVLISSRQANMLDDVYCSAKLKLAWAHDVVLVNATNRVLLKADRILALSNWHKEFLLSKHNVHESQIIVTRNGIHSKRFKQNVPRNPFKVVNSSSPDRGWPVLLECWDEIKSAVPQAELHLFYGFGNWEMIAKQNPQQAAPALTLRDRALSMKDKGVFSHGRVSQQQLAQEFLSAGIWAHPTWFTETSCITAMEAQCAGLKCITSNLAALQETVGAGIKIDGDCNSPEYKKIFVKHVIHSLKNTSDDERKQIVTYAKEHFELSVLAKEWQNMFYSLLKEVKVHPGMPYMPTETYRG
jgi:glycosyltransferase involved in cell wall biosynthesis